MSPNGGTYIMPTAGNATIKTKLTASDAGESGIAVLQYAWSTSNTTEPTALTTFTNGSEIKKTDCTAGTYYLWTKVTDKAGNRADTVKVSSAFTVGANTVADNKISITATPTSWTNGNVIATVTYGKNITANKKAGLGSANTANATTVKVETNGTVYAEGTDAAGNKATAQLSISNIDKTKPTVSMSPNGGTYIMPTTGNATIKTTLTASDAGESGIAVLQYAWSTSNTTEPTTWTTFTSGSEIKKTDCTAGTYYLWTRVLDGAGNRNTTGKVSNAFTVGANTVADNKISIIATQT